MINRKFIIGTALMLLAVAVGGTLETRLEAPMIVWLSVFFALFTPGFTLFGAWVIE